MPKGSGTGKTEFKWKVQFYWKFYRENWVCVGVSGNMRIP